MFDAINRHDEYWQTNHKKGSNIPKGVVRNRKSKEGHNEQKKGTKRQIMVSKTIHRNI